MVPPIAAPMIGPGEEAKHKPLFCSSGSGYSELVNDFVVVVVIAAAVVVICVVDCGVAVICIGVICVVVVIWGVIVSSVVVCVIFGVVFVDGHFEQSAALVTGQLQTDVDELFDVVVLRGHLVEFKHDMQSLHLFGHSSLLEKIINPGKYNSKTNSILVIIVNNRNEGFF